MAGDETREKFMAIWAALEPPSIGSSDDLRSYLDVILDPLPTEDRFVVNTSVMLGVWLAANVFYRAIEDTEGNSYLALLLAFNAALHRHWLENGLPMPKASFTENFDTDD
jgi:hypothetical protein